MLGDDLVRDSDESDGKIVGACGDEEEGQRGWGRVTDGQRHVRVG